MKYNFKVDKIDEKIRLDVYLQKKLKNITRSQIKRAIEQKNCFVNSKIQKAGFLVLQNDNIDIEIIEKKAFDTSAQDIPVDIIYEDEQVAVINKPSGLVVHPAIGNVNGTLVNALKFHFDKLSNLNGDFRPGIVHRLDKDTSGLLVVAKTNNAHISIAKQLQNKTCNRIYLAIVVGNIKENEGAIDKNLRRSKTDGKKIEICASDEGRRAITHFKALERFDGYCLVEFKLETGRTHQIRVHAKSILHPVACDKLYGYKDSLSRHFTRQLLHAYTLSFVHPTTNEVMTFTAPLPQDFIDALNILRR